MKDKNPFSPFDPHTSKPFKPKIPRSREEIVHSPSSNEEMSKISQHDVDTNKLLEKIFLMRQELEEKLNDIYEKTGIPRDEIERFINNPKNFSGAEWENIAKEKKQLEDQLYAILKLEKRHPTKKEVSDQASKDRKGKVLGGRKKWIPIR